MNPNKAASFDFGNNQEIESHFHISLKSNDISLGSLPHRSESCLVMICLNGYADINVDLQSCRLKRNDIFLVFPGVILLGWKQSDDFEFAYFSFSNHLIDEILFRFPAAFIGFLKENATYSLPEEEKEELFTEYFAILDKRYTDTANVCRSEIIQNLLCNFYLDLYSKIVRRNDIYAQPRQRKKELHEAFLQLLKRHPNRREVSFFANELCITPKYLSIIAKESTGNTAKEMISNYAVAELKLRLKSDSTPLKEIADQLEYPGEAFLCRFFKKLTGITPSRYRNEQH